MEEHNKILEKFLKRTSVKEVRVNTNTSKFRLTEIKYMGHVLTSEGNEFDWYKVEACWIKEIRTPVNTDELGPFLRICHLRKFLNLSHRQFKKLDEKNVLWDCQLILQYFDEKQKVLSVDSSKYGLDADIMQIVKRVAYAFLSDCQRNYAQIEKEMFGIVIDYTSLYIGTFFVETDHKTL